MNPSCISGIQELESEFCPPWGSLSSREWTLLLDVLTQDCRCRRSSAAAAAAAAAFRGGRGCPYRGGNSMHAWRFNLHFDIVRILWALPIIYHGRFWRFETHIIQVVFLRAQRGTVAHHGRVVTMIFIHNSFVTTAYENTYGVSWWTQWRYLHFNTKNITNCSNLNI